VIRGGSHVVYVLDESNMVHIRQVETGMEGNKLAEIKSGLKPGERVIIGGQEHYREGQGVTPVLAQEPASETQQESGGTIDLNADAQTEGPPELPTPEERGSGTLQGQRGQNGVRNESGSSGSGGKRVDGGVR